MVERYSYKVDVEGPIPSTPTRHPSRDNLTNASRNSLIAAELNPVYETIKKIISKTSLVKIVLNLIIAKPRLANGDASLSGAGEIPLRGKN